MNIFEQAILEMLEVKTTPRVRTTKNFAPSLLGSPCERKIYYTYNCVAEEAVKQTLPLKVALEAGKAYEEIVLSFLRNAGMTLVEDPTSFNKQIQLSSSEIGINKAFIDVLHVKDNVAYVAEIKSCTLKDFKDIEKKNLPKPTHLVQGVLYLYILRSMLKNGRLAHLKEMKDVKIIKSISFIYMCKDSGAIKIMELDKADGVFTDIYKKITRIKEFSEKKILPAKTFDFCMNCSFKSKCYKEFNDI